jgi:DNA-binding HxlR family transcriptional regulator
MHLRETPAQPTEHTDGLSPFCPRFQYAIELIGRRWVGAILRVLVTSPARFNELLAAIPGLSDRLLTERLRELEREGIVTRTVAPCRPIRVTYELTACGRSLGSVMAVIGNWSESWVDLPPTLELPAHPTTSSA